MPQPKKSSALSSQHPPRFKKPTGNSTAPHSDSKAVRFSFGKLSPTLRALPANVLPTLADTSDSQHRIKTNRQMEIGISNPHFHYPPLYLNPTPIALPTQIPPSQPHLFKKTNGNSNNSHPDRKALPLPSNAVTTSRGYYVTQRLPYPHSHIGPGFSL